MKRKKIITEEDRLRAGLANAEANLRQAQLGVDGARRRLAEYLARQGADHD